MRHRSNFAIVLGLVIGIASVAGSVRLAAQRMARTPDGHPDLQGMWLNNTATPLERPKDLGGRSSFTTEEARAYEQQYQLDRTLALSRDRAFELSAAGDLDTYEPGHVLPGGRASLITDPSDGAVPPLIPEAQRRLTERTQYLERHFTDNPEDLRNAERCLIVGNSSVPPLMPAFYNNNLQIVQTRNYVMILSEMIHDVRIIAMDGRAHLPAAIRMWKGDSVGRWDGDTLVVDTTNFTDKTPFRGSSANLHVIERFTLRDANTLAYQFTIDDAASFSRSWSGESEMSRTNDLMYEYACHEANYSLPAMLKGARLAEDQPAK